MAEDFSILVDDEKPFTAEEKQWFKVSGYKDDFLAAHGLSIYKDEHRQEGRALARGCIMMEKYEQDQADAEKKAAGPAPTTSDGKK